jgi:hypothetical protein
MRNETRRACALAVLLGGAALTQGCERRFEPFPEEKERSSRSFEEKRLEGREAEESYGHERARAERLDFLEAATARLDAIERSIGTAHESERVELRKSIERAPDVSAIDWQDYKLLTNDRLAALE